MISVGARIISDTARPGLARAMANLTPARFAGRVGPMLAQKTQLHIARQGTNKMGYPSSHFYEKFARNVRWFAEQRGVSVAILPVVINGRVVGMALRVFGGTITAVTAGALAISISPVSYNKVPSDFPGLFLLKTLKGAYLVQPGEQVLASGHIGKGTRLGGHAGRRLRAGLNFLFVLKGSATHAGNRDAVPSDEELLETAAALVQFS